MEAEEGKEEDEENVGKRVKGVEVTQSTSTQFKAIKALAGNNPVAIMVYV